MIYSPFMRHRYSPLRSKLSSLLKVDVTRPTSGQDEKETSNRFSLWFPFVKIFCYGG